MIITHKELVEKAKALLREKGFKEKEIFVEYNIKLKSGGRKVLDVAGIRGKEIIGIECGGLTVSMDIIKEVVTEFIYLPYVTKSGKLFHCSYCGHSWYPRIKKPKACPGCKRYFPLMKFQNVPTLKKQKEKKQ